MDLVQPTTWTEALAARADRPELLPIAGGTDVMVDLNFDRRRPAGLLDLTRVEEIGSWSIDGDVVRLGAGVTGEIIHVDSGFHALGMPNPADLNGNGNGNGSEG